MKLVKIVWEDPASYSERKPLSHAIADSKLGVWKSVGFVIYEDDRQITITFHLTYIESFPELVVEDIMVIPKKAIISMEEIESGD